MKRSISSLVLVLVATAFSAVAGAAPKVYSVAKLQITFPEGWGVKEDKSGMTMAGAPGNEAGIVVFAMPNLTPEAVGKAVEELLKAMGGTAVTWEADVMKGSTNSLPLFARKGTTTFEGKPHDIATVVVMNGTNGLVLLGVVRHDVKDKHQKAYEGIVQSIQVAK